MTIGNTAEIDKLVHRSDLAIGEVCACPACAGTLQHDDGMVLHAVSSPQDFFAMQGSVDRLAGTTAANGKPIWTADQIAAHLNRSGSSWVGGPDPATQGDTNLREITFGFHESQQTLADNGYVYVEDGEAYGLDEYFNFAAFNADQRAAARVAMGFWDDVVSVSFRETSDIDVADIAFGNLASAPQTQAYARLPDGTIVPGDPELNAQVERIVGDVWVSASQPSNFQLKPGGYGLNTLTHEIGHAIGLLHPGDYNFGPGFSVSYANGAEYYQDARNYTIMSYWNPRDIGARDYNWNTMSLAYGGTPMIHDILAVQKMYGVDTTTRTGNTVYGFNSTAGKDVFDFTINVAPTVTIWDAGGTDTLDASGYLVDQEINLNPGSLSSIGGVTQAEALSRLSFEQVNANRAAQGFAPTTRATYDANMAALAANAFLGRLTDNVGIAYGATIENAVGGSGNDVLVANDVANVLTGGAGNDLVSYREATAGVSASLLSARGTAGAANGDRYVTVEGLEGSAFNDTLIGNGFDNLLIGGAGADVLNGGGGVDTASYRTATRSVMVSLQTMTGSLGDAAGDRLTSIEALEGGAGDDMLIGWTGNDTLTGGAGNDMLVGNAGNDTLVGGLGDDNLQGGAGNDALTGGAGNDALDGGAGNDVLNGGLGNDRLFGGAGNDVFRFTDLGGADGIADFTRGQDRIDVSGLDAVAGGAVDAFAWIGGAAFSSTAGELRSYVDNGAYFVAGDVNGDGVADFTIQTYVQIVQSDMIFA